MTVTSHRYTSINWAINIVPQVPVYKGITLRLIVTPHRIVPIIYQGVEGGYTRILALSNNLEYTLSIVPEWSPLPQQDRKQFHGVLETISLAFDEAMMDKYFKLYARIPALFTTVVKRVIVERRLLNAFHSNFSIPKHFQPWLKWRQLLNVWPTRYSWIR